MLRTVAFCLVGLMCLTVPVAAHEVKVFASHYLLADDTSKATVYLSWGHRVPVDELTDAATIERYVWINTEGKVTTLKAEGKSLQANVVQGKEPGIYQVAVIRKPSVFTYVLDSEGNRQLKRGPRSSHEGANIHSAMRSVQSAKTLLCLGKPGDQAPAPAGLPLEILPVVGPSGWKTRGEIRFRVLLEGKPLSSAQVLARSLNFKPENAWNYATTSNRKGEFTLVPDAAGTWLIKVNTRRPSDAKVRREYDEESFTTTLSLEVQP
jgi:uncharacterized GH25 family protein